MVAINLEQVQQLPDTLMTHRFTLEFPPLPGGNDTGPLAIQCQQMAFPGSAINQVDTLLHGFKRLDFGRKEHPGTLSATFVENRGMPVWIALKQWQEEIRGTRSGSSSAPRNQLVVTALVTVYDEMDAISGSAQIFNCWPQDVPEVSLSSDSDQAFLVTATFAYDYIEYNNINIR